MSDKEAGYQADIREMAYAAVLELRDTIKPGYDAVMQGYNDPNHARLTIVQQVSKRMDKRSAQHLKEMGS